MLDILEKNKKKQIYKMNRHTEKMMFCGVSSLQYKVPLGNLL